MKLQYCNLCLATNLRPNAKFIDGICIACKFSQKPNFLNHKNMMYALNDMIKKHQASTRSNSKYNCVVGVSGGKDSTRQALWVRDRLKMRPVLVHVSYPPRQTSEIGAHNIANLMREGFDIISAVPAPQTSRELSKLTFLKFGNVCKSTEMALFATVPRIAIDKKIKLIFWGENPALQVGDSASGATNPFDGNNLRNLNTLQEGGVDWLDAFGYKKNQYIYPDYDDFTKNKIQIIYLGAVWNDWSNKTNSELGALGGLALRPGEKELTGDLSEASMLDEEFTNINMMIKYYKFGFGRATDQVNEMIRNGEITRCKAIEIVKKYDGVCDDEIIERYCKYIGISVHKFWETLSNFVNRDLFELANAPLRRPIRKFEIGMNIV